MLPARNPATPLKRTLMSPLLKVRRTAASFGAVCAFLAIAVLTTNYARIANSTSCQNNTIPNLNDYSCTRLGLPKPIDEIPLPPSAFGMDRGQANNFVIGIFDNKEVQMEEGQPPLLIHMALPRPIFSKRINEETGRFEKMGNSENTWDRASASKVDGGIFIDVGGHVGDSCLPSAALGIDTYVFEPVRANTNLIHYSILANHCRISEHLTVVNALVGDKDSAAESVYVTERADNAAATKAQAVKVVGNGASDYEQPVHMIQLDTFFPPKTKVQNLKIDVQGFEMHVLRGSKRILMENKGRLRVRLEYDEGLLKLAGTDPSDLLNFMDGLDYKVIKRVGQDIDIE